MVLEKITRVSLDPVTEFDTIIKFQKDERWIRTSVTTVLVTYERTEYDFDSTVDDLLREVGNDGHKYENSRQI